MIEVPVLVVGGGPVGLTTALALQRRNIRVLVVERNPTTTRHPKMDVTNGRSMEHFRRLGIADRIRDIAVPRDHCMDVAWVTRLSEWELARFEYVNVHEWHDNIRAQNDGSQPLEPNMRLSQVVLEPALREILETCPLVDLRFGWAFESLTQDAEGVTATIRNTATGVTETVRCALLAGCDGSLWTWVGRRPAGRAAPEVLPSPPLVDVDAQSSRQDRYEPNGGRQAGAQRAT
jgi:2-polyprenyl-6-methoxyphenol hydroxylase-like FAD-dependent oxidoreductase